MARYIPHMGDFNLQLVYKPRVMNKADLLSRQPDFNQGKMGNEEVLVLLPHFVFQYNRRSKHLGRSCLDGTERTRKRTAMSPRRGGEFSYRVMGGSMKWLLGLVMSDD
jgi:hypothetical protein